MLKCETTKCNSVEIEQLLNSMDEDINCVMKECSVTSQFTCEYIKDMLKYIMRNAELLKTIQKAMEEEQKEEVPACKQSKLDKSETEKNVFESKSNKNHQLSDSYRTEKVCSSIDHVILPEATLCNKEVPKPKPEGLNEQPCDETGASESKPYKKLKTSGTSQISVRSHYRRQDNLIVTNLPAVTKVVLNPLNNKKCAAVAISHSRKSDVDVKTKSCVSEKANERGRLSKSLSPVKKCDDKTVIDTEICNSVKISDSLKTKSPKNDVSTSEFRKWTREEDREILLTMQKYGATTEAFVNIAKSLQGRNKSQVEERFAELMDIYKKALEEGKLQQ